MVSRILFPQAKSSTPRPRELQGRESHSPPPPYSSSNSPELPSVSQPIFSEMVTTTVTTTTQTTHTTTHFFSLPLWRRRGGPQMSGALTDDPSNARQYYNVGEDGAITRASVYNVDKDLPAVPHSENVEQLTPVPQGLATQHRSESPSQIDCDAYNGDAGSSQHSPSLEATPSTSQLPSTVVLARAALGIGLPHVMPRAAAYTSSPDVMNIPEQRTLLGSTPNILLSPDLRRSRSFMRARSEYFPDVSDAEDRFRGPRRNTVVALDPEKLDYEGKGKGRAVEQGVQDNPNHQPRVLSRRSSFWNRRRVQSMKSPPSPQPVPSLGTSQTLAPALPKLQPISPMFSDMEFRSSPAQSPSSSTFEPPMKLRRRHSERGAPPMGRPGDTILTPGVPPLPDSQSRRPTSPEISRQSGDSVRYTSQFLTSGSNQSTNIGASIGPPVESLPHSPPLQNARRPRSMTNPSSLLHRLSMGFFSQSPHPSPLSSPTVSTNVFDEKFASSSPRTSASLMRSSISKSTVEIPKPKEDEESPELFLARLEEAVSRAEIVNVLAGNGDPFYTQALQLYMDRFDFANDPLDISLRKMLMDVGLPKETQQIDRVMEAFASRYLNCNPGLFVSNDHPYILAFSLIMLHTDFFNKSNKRKMTKADYIKNTRLVGVPADVLDYFYDNIVFAPFIFIEDPVDINGQRGFVQEGHSSPAKIVPAASGQGQSGFSVLNKSNRIDPYYLITGKLLAHLRVDIKSHIPLRNPFSYQGTAGSWNEGELRRSFARADIIEIDSAETRRMSTLPFLSLTTGGAPGPMMQGLPLPYIPEPDTTLSSLSTLRMTKVGRLNRKDDLLDGGKRSTSRKWRECSIILAGSQLLFFRDPTIASELIPQLRSAGPQVLSSQLSLLSPEELLSVKDTIAVSDLSYTKHRNVLRLVLPAGRQIFLQAESEQECNEWIAHVNYASAFKSAGIRMRPLTTSEDHIPELKKRRSNSVRTSENSLESSHEKTASTNMLNPESVPFRVPLPSLPTDETAGSQSRSRIIRSKLKDLGERIISTRSQLDAEMRVVRNLALLTPFQRSTRNRLQLAVTNLGKTVRQLRLEIVRTTCYRDILAADLASEEREGKHQKNLALKEASHAEATIPRMTLSIHEDDGLHESSVASLSHSDLTDLSTGRPESSICESFHSALDINLYWQIETSVSARSPSRSDERAATRTSSSVPRKDQVISLEVGPPASERTDSSARDSSEHPLASHDRSKNSDKVDQRSSDAMECDEQAEEWHKTRAAKRVSLVKVPHNLSAIGRHDGRRTEMRMDKTGPLAIPESDDVKLLQNI